MRMFILLVLCVAYGGLTAQTDDMVLFTVNDEDVYLSEFRYIYEKNNSDNADYSEESVMDYLDLYKKFKLKVHKARDMGLDTIVALQQELDGYRKQLAKSYLKDREINNRLIEEVVERMNTDIEVSHIFVSAEEKTSAARLESASTKINEIHQKLKEGAPFNMMAKTLSEDKASAGREGYLGYYTAPLPDGFYAFENAMYDTPVDSFSTPVRSKMGFHIIKVHDTRPARGQMEIAHILIRKKSPQRMHAESKAIADTVYTLLKQGRNYENMAAKFSEDSKTKARGGYLGYLGINQFERKFEDAAFALSEDGAFSEPVETELGWHIIKRISKRDDSNKDLVKKRVKAQISNNERFHIAEKNLISQVKKQEGFTEYPEVLEGFIEGLTDDFFSYKWQAPSLENDPELFILGNEKYYLSDFAAFVKSSVKDRLRFNQVKSRDEAVQDLYEKFTDEMVMAFEEKNLENKYPDFKSLMREYSEGILLFEITKQEVWDKASRDTTGLRAFYRDHREDYKWPERVKVMVYEIESEDERAAISVYKYAQKKDRDKVLEKYGGVPDLKLTTRELVLEKEDERIREMQLKPGGQSSMNMEASSARFYKFIEMMPPETKSLEEARGYVIADYQDYLEKKWIEKLQEEYKVRVNKPVLKSIIDK